MASRGNCLIIEDDEDIAGLLELILSQDGFTVHIERNGSAGVRAAASLEDLELITLDLGLPDITGLSVASTLRTFTSVPVLVITAFTVLEDELAVLAAGASAFMLKPFRPSELRAAIDQLCPQPAD